MSICLEYRSRYSICNLRKNTEKNTTEKTSEVKFPGISFVYRVHLFSPEISLLLRITSVIPGKVSSNGPASAGERGTNDHSTVPVP